ncbi:MAG: DUF512 domain-containing protein [Clostridia bacterium]|nr:DUF512 domain-containing protein [Clostridia bacterium]
MSVAITGIGENSPCLGKVQVGERLEEINGSEIVDVLDYMHFSIEKDPTLTLLDLSGKQRKLRVKKPRYEDLGLEFDSFLMDTQRGCANRCIFCFIDQLPKGLRETLYFKDDDARLSFLMGNYISMTNLSERDVQRMIDYRVSPINVSVHTTNPALRSRMLGNRRGGESLAILERFAQAGLDLNCQVVVCKGVNDREELSATLEKLISMAPAVDSIAVVPAGLTGHREGLYPLELQSREDAADTVARVEAAGQEALRAHGRRIVFASDELYLAAGLPIPDYDYYEDFPQIENGIGMIAMLREEVMGALPGLVPPQRSRKVTAVTGESVFPYLRVLVDEIENKCNNNLSVNLIPIRNDFFGGGINVTGLVTGGDIVKQLGGKPLGEALIVPAVMLRYDRVCFLDDMTVEQLSQELDIPIVIAEMSGEGLIESMTGQPLGGV